MKLRNANCKSDSLLETIAVRGPSELAVAQAGTYYGSFRGPQPPRPMPGRRCRRPMPGLLLGGQGQAPAAVASSRPGRTRGCAACMRDASHAIALPTCAPHDPSTSVRRGAARSAAPDHRMNTHVCGSAWQVALQRREPAGQPHTVGSSPHHRVPILITSRQRQCGQSPPVAAAKQLTSNPSYALCPARIALAERAQALYYRII